MNMLISWFLCSQMADQAVFLFLVSQCFKGKRLAHDELL